MPDLTFVFRLLGPAMGVIGLYFILIGVAYYLGSRTAFAKAFFQSSTPPAIAAVVLFLGLYLLVITISAQFASDTGDFAYSIAAATFGLTLGWVLGIVISPTSKDEAGEFSMLTKAVSTFITGYVLANLKGITKEDLVHFLSRPEVPFRLMIGTASCLSALATIFVIRRAEAMHANAKREWFVSYAPAVPKHDQALPADVLARGPFATRDDALEEIKRIQGLPEFKGRTLSAVRVDILSEESVLTPPAAAATTTTTGSSTTGSTSATSTTAATATTTPAAAASTTTTSTTTPSPAAATTTTTTTTAPTPSPTPATTPTPADTNTPTTTAGSPSADPDQAEDASSDKDAASEATAPATTDSAPAAGAEKKDPVVAE